MQTIDLPSNQIPEQEIQEWKKFREGGVTRCVTRWDKVQGSLLSLKSP